MPSIDCVCCRIYFEEGEKLPAESINLQYKNYYLPFKESKIKWILLKTIVGYLNSKGGTLFIGVEDKEGKVIGQQISRKHQDEFMLFIKELVERIKPKVDLVFKQEINIKFIPVVSKKNKVFTRKYVIKINVKQGDPSSTYHFSQTINLEYKYKTEQFQIFHGFYRHNMGGVVEIKGEDLLEEIKQRASNPQESIETFHKLCNPQPLKLQNPITKIGFSGVRKEELRFKLESIFEEHLQKFDVQYQLTYDIQNQVLVIQLDNEMQFKEINTFIKNQIHQFNSNKQFNFVEKGVYLDFYLYKNILKRKKSSSKEKIQESPLEQQQQSNSLKQQGQDIQLSSESITSQKQEQRKQKIFRNVKRQSYKETEKQQTDKILEKEYIISLTHIDPSKKNDLLSEIIKLTQEGFKIEQYYIYQYTIQLKFHSRQETVDFHSLLIKNHNHLKNYGIRNNLFMGVNLNCIRILNYNKNKRKQLRQYLQKLIGEDLEEAEYKKSNNRFFLEIKFRQRSIVCNWLDKLQSNEQIHAFGPPSTKSYRMKIFLYLATN